MIKSIRFFDWPFFASIILLSLMGLMMIYSTGLSGDIGSSLWIRQLVSFGIGLVGLLFLSNLDYRIFKQASGVFYIGAILLLIAVLFFGREIRGSVRWFELGPVNFQPAEFSKFALIVLLAKYFSVRGALLQKFRYVLWSFVYALIPMTLIMMQPDLGSAAVHAVLWVGMLMVSPMPKRYLLYLFVIFVIFSIFAWSFLLADFQKARVMTFIDPTADPLGSGYNVIQSIVAVGSGGLTGQGLARGLQSQLQFLPERQTDFIFASTVEELGLIGGMFVLGLFFFALYRMIVIMRGARDSFGTYLAAGIFFLIFTQAAVNVGMNLGLLPVTGITLPFMSYGGSSLVMLLFLVGIIQSIAQYSVPVKFR